MDCREFRDRHAPFVDLMCSVQDEREMRRHMQACADCSRHDTRIRRAVMLVRSLPSIEPSPAFRARLEARLRQERLSPPVVAPRRSRVSVSAMAAVAAGLGAFAWLASGLVRDRGAPEVAMAPVVAYQLPSEPLHVATPAMVAAVPTGMSVWPAIMIASQAQMQLVAAELANER